MDNYKKPKQEKRYYSIGEVAGMFGVTKSLLRYWESEFPSLRPHKDSRGERRFTQQNIDELSLIYHLVKERGFTLEGARQELGADKERLEKKALMLEKLKKVRQELLDIRRKL